MTDMTTPNNKNRLPIGNCPYCDAERGITTPWGMSPEGWGNMKDIHDAGHLNFIKRGDTVFVSPTPDSMYGQIVHCDKCLGVIEKLSTGIPEGWNICNCSPTPTDSWENRFDRLFTNEIEYDLITREYIKIKSFISQVRQKAKEEVLRDIIVMETPTRGIEGETVMEYASSLGIDLSSNK